ncbi:hypothetical protein M405DRAFT_866756 [Rhizopogon salebrosus TDB-379]|nr:hypothetical protein M405DRAFT_866756 [Rhizopogon salebrosus TDB-379]
MSPSTTTTSAISTAPMSSPPLTISTPHLTTPPTSAVARAPISSSRTGSLSVDMNPHPFQRRGSRRPGVWTEAGRCDFGDETSSMTTVNRPSVIMQRPRPFNDLPICLIPACTILDVFELIATRNSQLSSAHNDLFRPSPTVHRPSSKLQRLEQSITSALLQC